MALTLQQLINGTLRLRPQTKMGRVLDIDYDYDSDKRILTANAVVQRSGGGLNTENTTIRIKVKGGKEGDAGPPVQMKNNPSVKFKPRKIRGNKNKVQVRCECEDFRFFWAPAVEKKKSLIGTFPPYIKKTNRPPRNPQQVPGLCKHLLAVAKKLQRDDFFQPGSTGVPDIKQERKAGQEDQPPLGGRSRPSIRKPKAQPKAQKKSKKSSRSTIVKVS